MRDLYKTMARTKTHLVQSREIATTCVCPYLFKMSYPFGVVGGIVTYKIHRRDLTEWIRTRIQEIEDCICENEVPTGEVSGVCKYCKYQTKCHNDGNGLTDKPLSIPKTTLNSALMVDEGKDMKTFNISANVIRNSSTKLILSLRESHKGVNNKVANDR